MKVEDLKDIGLSFFHVIFVLVKKNRDTCIEHLLFSGIYGFEEKLKEFEYNLENREINEILIKKYNNEDKFESLEDWQSLLEDKKLEYKCCICNTECDDKNYHHAGSIKFYFCEKCYNKYKSDDESDNEIEKLEKIDMKIFSYCDIVKHLNLIIKQQNEIVDYINKLDKELK